MPPPVPLPVQFVLFVLAPAFVVALPVLYAEPRLAGISGFYGLLYLALLGWLFRSALRRYDRLRANHAEMADWRSGYLLVLRSFGRPELYQDTLLDRGPDSWASPPMEESLIGAIEAAVHAEGLRLVALGGDFVLPADHRLFWLTTADKDWQYNFERLADGARAILVFPETTGGIALEVSFLREVGHLAKTVFCMPQTREAGGVTTEYEMPEAKAARWAQTREHLADQGIDLPVYMPEGRFLWLDAETGSVRMRRMTADPRFGKARPLTATGRRKQARMIAATRAAIFGLLPRHASDETSFADVLTKLRLGPPRHDDRWCLSPPGSPLGHSLAWLVVMGLIAGVLHNVWSLFFTLGDETWLPLLLLAVLAMLAGMTLLGWLRLFRGAENADPGMAIGGTLLFLALLWAFLS